MELTIRLTREQSRQVPSDTQTQFLSCLLDWLNEENNFRTTNKKKQILFAVNTKITSIDRERNRSHLCAELFSILINNTHS